MMKNDYLGRNFKILDSQGRCWGRFTVEKETCSFNECDIHGILIPSDDFMLIKPLFIRHELEMQEEGDVEEINVDQLLELKPYLVDIESEEKINVCGALFITENLLVTCGIDIT